MKKSYFALLIFALVGIPSLVMGVIYYQHEKYLRTHYCAVDEGWQNVNGVEAYTVHFVTCKQVEIDGDPGQPLPTNEPVSNPV